MSTAPKPSPEALAAAMKYDPNDILSPAIIAAYEREQREHTPLGKVLAVASKAISSVSRLGNSDPSRQSDSDK